jgi:hypothetical protein
METRNAPSSLFYRLERLDVGVVRLDSELRVVARIQKAIPCHHRVLRVFKSEVRPQEFAILHNNLAIA